LLAKQKHDDASGEHKGRRRQARTSRGMVSDRGLSGSSRVASPGRATAGRWRPISDMRPDGDSGGHAAQQRAEEGASVKKLRRREAEGARSQGHGRRGERSGISL
jgi:hypothetical protein